MSHPLSKRFQTFAEIECKDSSPLYYFLSRIIALDDTLLSIAEQSRCGQPVPNLFFAAVQYLLFIQTEHPLAQYYASLCSFPLDPADAYPHFRHFVFAHQADVIHLLKSRLVQTNEVRRSALPLPSHRICCQLL